MDHSFLSSCLAIAPTVLPTLVGQDQDRRPALYQCTMKSFLFLHEIEKKILINGVTFIMGFSSTRLQPVQPPYETVLDVGTWHHAWLGAVVAKVTYHFFTGVCSAYSQSYI